MQPTATTLYETLDPDFNIEKGDLKPLHQKIIKRVNLRTQCHRCERDIHITIDAVHAG